MIDRLTRPVFEIFARTVFCFYCPLNVTGRENLPPLPFLLCSNHQSHMDSIVLMVASGYRFKQFGLLAASDYFFRNKLVYKWFSGMVNLIPISRAPRPSALELTLSLARDFLSKGNRGLIVFPEGTRSVTGEMGPFKRGAGFISAQLGIPVVPVYIEGTRQAMPKGRPLPIPQPIQVRIGLPVHPVSDAEYDVIASSVYQRIIALKAS